MSEQMAGQKVNQSPIAKRVEYLRERASSLREVAAFEGGLSVFAVLNTIKMAIDNAGQEIGNWQATQMWVAGVTGGLAIYGALRSGAIENQADTFEAAQYQRDGILPSYMVENVVPAETPPVSE